MVKKKNKGRDDEKDIGVPQYVDDNGVVIENILDYLNQHDEELAEKVKEEVKNLDLLSAKSEFMKKLRKYNHLGIGTYAKYENLDEFLNWILTKRLL